MELEHVIKLVALAGGAIAVIKACWAVAQFFVGLSEGLRNLTTSVDKLTERFDTHTAANDSRIGEHGERIASLESWRESFSEAA